MLTICRQVGLRTGNTSVTFPTRTGNSIFISETWRREKNGNWSRIWKVISSIINGPRIPRKFSGARRGTRWIYLTWKVGTGRSWKNRVSVPWRPTTGLLIANISLTFVRKRRWITSSCIMLKVARNTKLPTGGSVPVHRISARTGNTWCLFLPAHSPRRMDGRNGITCIMIWIRCTSCLWRKMPRYCSPLKMMLSGWRQSWKKRIRRKRVKTKVSCMISRIWKVVL